MNKNIYTYFRLLKYVKPYYVQFLFSILGYFIFASTQPMLGVILKYFIDTLSNPNTYVFYSEFKIIYVLPILMIVISLLQGIGSFFGNFYLAKVSLGIVHDLRIDLFNKLLNLPNYYFDQNNSGHLISKITFNVTMVTGAATESIKILVREGLTCIFLMLSLIVMNWKLTIVIFMIFPIIILIVRIANKKLKKQSKNIQIAMGDITHVVSETIQSYRVVRIFNGESFEKKRFLNVSADNKKKNLCLIKTSSLYTPILQLCIYTSMAVLMFFVLLLRGNSSIGELVAYITIAGLLPKPLRQLSEISSTIQKGVTSAESIFEQLDELPEIDYGIINNNNIKGTLEVKNISFKYPGHESLVLNNISFNAFPGQTIALVGRSGSGKSTLAGLIPRFYLYKKGLILLDGIDINNYCLATLRKNITLVTQQITLFNDTIINNIAYGDLINTPRSLIEKAAEDAYAIEFIDRLPYGFNTMLGDNGVMLSGGQRQRIALARAFLKKAPILILDEATSSLDNESEKYIQAALESIIKNCTTIVIAHRLSTIKKADLILVMDKGNIIERGTHFQLIMKNGYYSNLHSNTKHNDFF